LFCKDIDYVTGGFKYLLASYEHPFQQKVAFDNPITLLLGNTAISNVLTLNSLTGVIPIIEFIINFSVQNDSVTTPANSFQYYLEYNLNDSAWIALPDFLQKFVLNWSYTDEIKNINMSFLLDRLALQSGDKFQLRMVVENSGTPQIIVNSSGSQFLIRNYDKLII
jgi:hypothetical protein